MLVNFIVDLFNMKTTQIGTFCKEFEEAIYLSDLKSLYATLNLLYALKKILINSEQFQMIEGELNKLQRYHNLSKRLTKSIGKK